VYAEGANMTESFGKKWPIQIAIVVLAILAANLPALAQQQAALATSSSSVHAVLAASTATSSAAKSDAAAAQAAFNRAWTVFVSPRCQNCHPSGDAPLQGDDSHVHIQDVKRGTSGRGVYGMRCSTCHQAANLPGDNMPPGNPKWSLPPIHMKMVIQGETAGEFCRQLKDPAKNGNRTLAQIIEHVSTDDLVGWGWNPGDGRTLPPLTRPEFVAAMKAWVDNGAACPQ
jgi:mono/diheme cytochrome c family protein